MTRLLIERQPKGITRSCWRRYCAQKIRSRKKKWGGRRRES